MCLDGGRGKDVEGKGVLWAVWLYTFSCLNLFFFQFLEIGGIWRGRDSKFRTLFGDFHFYPYLNSQNNNIILHLTWSNFVNSNNGDLLHPATHSSHSLNTSQTFSFFPLNLFFFFFFFFCLFSQGCNCLNKIHTNLVLIQSVKETRICFSDCWDF